MSRMGSFKGQKGLTTPMWFLTVLLIVVGGFLAIKVGGAYMDIDGIQADLEASKMDLPFDCAGSRSCGDKLVDAIEAIRDFHQREVELDYDSIDVDYDENVFTMKGTRTVDFKVRKYIWRFKIEIELP